VPSHEIKQEAGKSLRATGQDMAAVCFMGDTLLLCHDPPVYLRRARVSIEKFPELLSADYQRVHGPDRPDGRCPVTGHLTRDLPDNIAGAAQVLKHLLAITSNRYDLDPSRCQDKHMSRRLTLRAQRGTGLVCLRPAGCQQSLPVADGEQFQEISPVHDFIIRPPVQPLP
jgi:hypothetical protein